MTTTENIKTVPNSKESEMMVLGCMLTSIDALNIAADSLDDSDFYFTENKIIFLVLKSAYKNDKPADVHLVCEELRRQDKLKAIGGVAYITALAQYAGTSAYIEEYVNVIRDKSILRSMINAAENIQQKALQNPDDVLDVLEDFQDNLNKIQDLYGNNIPLISVSERFKFHDEMLKEFRGKKKYLGLRVKTIHEFNENLLGLRKLILLAAPPNVGKTALTIQLGQEVLLSEPDACLIYVSLEMTSEEIFTRMNLYQSGLNFRTYTFGSQQIEDNNETVHCFTQEELKKIESSKNDLIELGNRLQIIDASTCSNITSKIIINFVEKVKVESKCSRAIVIIDYLQVWPIPSHIRVSSDIEADKWRIGEIKKIRDALNRTHQDPVIVISEARKPSDKNDEWGGDLADVMGSARGTYTPDVVMLLTKIKQKELGALFEKFHIPNLNSCKFGEDKHDKIKNFLSHHGISVCKLNVAKGRDGMDLFNIPIEFHFRKNSFRKIDWNNVLGLVMAENNKK